MAGTEHDEGQEPKDGDEGQVPGAGSSDGGEGGAAGDGGEAKTFSESYVKDLRAEAAANRKKAAELEAKLREREQAEMSDKERAEAQAREAQQAAEATERRARDAILRAAVTEEAVKAGAVDAEAVRMMVADRIRFNDDGEPEGVADAVKALLEEKPYLKAAGDGGIAGAGAGSGNGHRGGTAGGTLTLSKLQAMSQEQIAALPQADVDAALARGV